ncbi:MAG: hypothetical protein ACE5FN_00965 [Leptospirillia bacterium]
MDYSHHPYMIYGIGLLAVLIGVLFAVLALVFLRTPKRFTEDGDGDTGKP